MQPEEYMSSPPVNPPPPLEELKTLIEVKKALIHFSVFLLGFIFCLVAYLNYILLKPYLTAAFWAITLAIPLHSFKRQVLNFLVESFFQEYKDGLVLGMTVVLSKVILKIILGPLWSPMNQIISTYFETVTSISRSPEKVPLTGSTSSASVTGTSPLAQHSVLPEQEQDPSDSESSKTGYFYIPRSASELRRRIPSSFHDRRFGYAESFVVAPASRMRSSQDSEMIRDRSISLSEKIVGEMLERNSSNSYFSVLVQCCLLYTVAKIVQNLSISTWLILALIFIILIGLHVLFHIVIMLWINQVLPFLDHYIVQKAPTWLAQATRFGMVRWLFQQVYGFTRQKVFGLRQRWNEWMYQNLNQLVTMTLLVSFAGFTVLTSGFVFFKIAGEANSFLDNAFSQINSTLDSASTFIPLSRDPSMIEKAHVAVTDLRTFFIQWSDERLQESFPGSNLTVHDLYDKAYHAYRFLKEGSDATVSNDNASTIAFFPITRGLASALWVGSTSTNEIRSLVIGSLVELKNYFQHVGSNVRSKFQNSRKPLLEALSTSGASVARFFSLGLVYVIQGFAQAFNVMLEFLVFAATLYYLVVSQHSPMYYLSQMLILVDPRHKIRVSIERTIKAILLSALKITLFHALFTWLTFSLAGIDYVYFMSFMSGLMAAIPVLPPFYIAIPPILGLLLNGSYWTALILLVCHLWAMWVVDTAIYSEVPDTHHYVMGYSIFLGVYAFGIEGVLLGPIISCFPVILYEILSDVSH